MAKIKLDNQCYFLRFDTFNIGGTAKRVALIEYDISKAGIFSSEQIMDICKELKKMYANPIIEVIEE